MSDQIHVGEFCGTASRSPSAQYTVAHGIYLDRNDTEDKHFILMDGERVIHQGRLRQRIESASVDDEGHFCLEQSAASETAKTRLLFFDRDGAQYGTVYAPDYVTFFRLQDQGRSVLLSYGQKLFLLSVSPTRVIFSFEVPPRFYATDGYLDQTTDDVLVADGDRGLFRFSRSGEFCDHTQWLPTFMASCDGPTLYSTIRDLSDKAQGWTPDDYRNAAGWIREALRRGIDDTFHLSRSDVYAFLAALCTAAGDEDGHAEALDKQDDSLDGFRLVDSTDERIKAILASQDSVAIVAELRRLDRAEAYPRLSTYPNYFGRLYKLRGELYLALGESDRAIDAFRRAIQINPKVGCKRQLDKLAKFKRGQVVSIIIDGAIPKGSHVES